MKKIVLLLLSAVLVAAASGSGEIKYECTDEDCGFYDDPTDPRNPYLDLLLDVEKLTETIKTPSWQMYFKFFDGKLQGDPNNFGNECACPLALMDDKVFVTFHSYWIADLWYSYKFPFSEEKDGALQITCIFDFSALLLNQTNHPPTFQKVEATSLDILNFIPYGVPMEWLDNLPEKYIDFIKKGISAPIKKVLGDALLKAFNENLKKRHRGQIGGKRDKKYRIMSNLVH